MRPLSANEYRTILKKFKAGYGDKFDEDSFQDAIIRYLELKTFNYIDDMSVHRFLVTTYNRILIDKRRREVVERKSIATIREAVLSAAGIQMKPEEILSLEYDDELWGTIENREV